MAINLKASVAKVGAAVRKILPKFLLGHEKAIAGFLTPIIAGQLARLVPGVDLDPSLIGTIVLGAITGLTVHTATNTEPAAG